MRRVFFSFFLAAMALSLSTPKSVAEDRALLIGINAYPIKPLKGPLNDVADMEMFVKETLGFKPEQVRVLRDSAANYEAIQRSIDEWLISGTTPGDRAFLYFAGHGTQIPDEDGDETKDGLDEALLPIDFAAGQGRFLTDDALAVALDALSDRRVTVIIDACNSGTISRTLSPGTSSPATARYVPVNLTRGIIRKPPEPESEPAVDDLREALSDSAMIDTVDNSPREIWMASAAYQQTFEGSFNGRRHGVLTRAFLEANSGAADLNGNGRISRSEILDHIRKRAAQFCDAAEACHSSQRTLTPILEAPPALRGLPLSEWPSPKASAPTPTQPAETTVTAQLPTTEAAPIEATPAEVTTKATPLQTTTAEEQQAQPEAIPPKQAPPRHKADALTDLVQGGGLPTTLRLTPFEDEWSGQVRAGDRFSVEVTTEAAGQLLLYIAPDEGEVTQLFPLSLSQKNTRLKPHIPIRVPTLDYGFKLVLPKGTGTLFAIVTAEEVAIKSLDPLISAPEAAVTPRSLRGQTQSLAAIMANLTAPVTEGLENRSGRYGVASLRYGE